jgi:hypothetical protein
MPAELHACVDELMKQGKDEDSAFAICTDSLQKAGKLTENDVVELKAAWELKKKKKRMETYAELDQVEILQVGALPERGIAFTRSDLKEIANNTNQLIAEGLHNPPGKLGHEDDQAFARESGLPAAGWVESLSVVGDKLLAKFKDVPKILMRAFKEKLYRKISSEVYFDFSHPKTHQSMGKVLRAVAFLGADIPQVKGLADFLGEKPKAYAFMEGEHARMGEINISITLPDPNEAPAMPPVSPETPVTPAPGPIAAEGLAGRDLEYYRQAEAVADQLKRMAVPEFDSDASVESMLRFVGRTGAVTCSSMPEFRQRSDNPEGLCAWLEARAKERGYVAIPPAEPTPKEESAMDPKKMEELSAKLAEAESARATSEKESVELKDQVKKLSEEIAAERKKQFDTKVGAFVEANKASITPAIEPAFRALCESVGEGEVEVKLSENPEKIGKTDLVMRFTEALIKAKVVPLGEIKGDKEQAEIDFKTPKGANYRVELHEQAQRLVAEKKISYGDAIREAVKANPELAA